ncbi:unnamed protein product [Protopolystoma xenopodis]|uniref:Uncharacterized protein n=1 Tax=Protopolystoma xenopodis TaxID=117903 RepID=A0A3S5C2V4_9PLAT|nr:unnamed protein product [Protopolystoma xenopodis]
MSDYLDDLAHLIESKLVENDFTSARLDIPISPASLALSDACSSLDKVDQIKAYSPSMPTCLAENPNACSATPSSDPIVLDHTHKPSGLRCSICGDRYFTRPSNLAVHMQSHRLRSTLRHAQLADEAPIDREAAGKSDLGLKEAGQFVEPFNKETSRRKFYHCMVKQTLFYIYMYIYKLLFNLTV